MIDLSKRKITDIENPIGQVVLAREFLEALKEIQRRLLLLETVVAHEMRLALCSHCENAWFDATMYPGLSLHGSKGGVVLNGKPYCVECIDWVYDTADAIDNEDDWVKIMYTMAAWIAVFPVEGAKTKFGSDPDVRNIRRQFYT